MTLVFVLRMTRRAAALSVGVYCRDDRLLVDEQSCQPCHSACQNLFLFPFLFSFLFFFNLLSNSHLILANDPVLPFCLLTFLDSPLATFEDIYTHPHMLLPRALEPLISFVHFSGLWASGTWKLQSDWLFVFLYIHSSLYTAFWSKIELLVSKKKVMASHLWVIQEVGDSGE